MAKRKLGIQNQNDEPLTETLDSDIYVMGMTEKFEPNDVVVSENVTFMHHEDTMPLPVLSTDKEAKANPLIMPAGKSFSIEYNLTQDKDGEANLEIVKAGVEEKQTAKQQVTTVDEMLNRKLFERLKLFRDAEDLEEFYIIDRFNSSDFVYAFRDGLYAYREDAVIAERLIPKSLCTKSTKQMFVLPEEAEKIAKQLKEYVSKIHWDFLSEVDISEIENDIKTMEEQLSREDMKPQLKDVEVLVYKDEYAGKEILVTPLKNVSDEVLMQYSGILSRFIVTYFLSMRLVFSERFSVSLTPVKQGDLLDIIAIFSLD